MNMRDEARRTSANVAKLSADSQQFRTKSYLICLAVPTSHCDLVVTNKFVPCRVADEHAMESAVNDAWDRLAPKLQATMFKTTSPKAS